MTNGVITHNKEGKILEIPYWKYLLNWWSPIFGIITIIVIGAIFFSNLSERIFANGQQKYEVVKHVEDIDKGIDELHLTKENKNKYVERKEIESLKEYWDKQLTDIKDLIKENRQAIGKK